MKKTPIVLALLLLFSMLLSACGGTDNKGDSSNSSGDTINLTWYYPVNVGGEVTKVIDGYAEAFNKEGIEVNGKKVTVEPVYSGNYDESMTKVQTAVKNGKAPDMAVLLSVDLFQIKDSIIALDDMINNDSEAQEMMEDFFPGFMLNSQAEGKTWSIPFQRSTVLLYYNKDMFEEAGLDPEKAPTNWDEVIEYGKQLTKDGKWGIELPATISGYWIYQALALQNGDGNLMSDDGKDVYFNTEEAKGALQYWIDLSKKHKIMPDGVLDWNTVPTDFIEGKTAMMLSTTGNLTNVKNNANFEFGVAFLPGKERLATPTGGGNFYIFKDIPEERQLAAMEFIKWIAQPERAAEWSIDTGYIATRQSSYETPELKEYTESFPQALTAMEQLEHAHKEISVYEQGKIIKILQDAIQAAINGDDVSEALDKAQEQAEELLKPYQ
ncbi:sn-glycerol 3-phosphate transport system substrate-binding protein [Cerasibacillus quisquiliarum]|uniref:ABC transporter substrate-binding protein n=1 Tax=Cerasibacillus quisquiliarum TaxID=227865 RepID=A0A511UXC0_9BACI|nr:ABC transporter substrate-binding protein [Cerasibacillus quisquiliarum]MBB5144993.1 sn-glycerol 3-phosphate transport system substrate-binding protein [Cerasibacillus quisquiliarum]GEN30113.1 ABC transporter substrate-binding protein [Cerasibacillus quisquiliarum]